MEEKIITNEQVYHSLQPNSTRIGSTVVKMGEIKFSVNQSEEHVNFDCIAGCNFLNPKLDN